MLARVCCGMSEGGTDGVESTSGPRDGRAAGDDLRGATLAGSVPRLIRPDCRAGPVSWLVCLRVNGARPLLSGDESLELTATDISLGAGACPSLRPRSLCEVETHYQSCTVMKCEGYPYTCSIRLICPLVGWVTGRESSCARRSSRARLDDPMTRSRGGEGECLGIGAVPRM